MPTIAAQQEIASTAIIIIIINPHNNTTNHFVWAMARWFLTDNASKLFTH